jgi:endonuclease YncB( thermonuclease family)
MSLTLNFSTMDVLRLSEEAGVYRPLAGLSTHEGRLRRLERHRCSGHGWHANSRQVRVIREALMLQKLGVVRVSWIACSLVIAACDKGATVKDGDSVKVTDLVKGDELVVDKGGTRSTVRLLGIHVFSPAATDATVAELGKRSQVRVGSLLIGKDVTLKLGTQTKDAYGRFLSYAALGHEDVGLMLIAQGVAVAYTAYAFDREAAYFAAEEQARAAKIGLWAHPGAVDLVLALRSLWSQERTARGEPAPKDTWVEITRTNAPAPGPPPTDAPEPDLP